MPAKTIADYKSYASRKLGNGKECKLFIQKRTGDIIHLTEVSFEEVNPQDLLAKYVQPTASILLIGYEEDRGELEKMKSPQNLQKLCTFLKHAMQRKIRVMRKVKKCHIGLNYGKKVKINIQAIVSCSSYSSPLYITLFHSVINYVSYPSPYPIFTHSSIIFSMNNFYYFIKSWRNSVLFS